MSQCGTNVALACLTSISSVRVWPLPVVAMDVPPKVEKITRRLFALGAPKVSSQEFVKLAHFVCELGPHAWNPKVLITAVLLLGWMEPGLMADQFEVVEFFAGRARVSQAARKVGMSAAALDVLYHENKRVLDMTSSPGFASQGCNFG